MANTSAKDIRRAVKEILRGADLSTLSVKKIRLRLQEKFNADFTERKKEVDGIVMELLNSGQFSASEDESSSKSIKTKSKNNADDSEEEQNQKSSDESGVEDSPPKKKKKKASKKEKVEEIDAEFEPSGDFVAITNDFDPEDPDKMNDEEIARQLQDMNDGPRRSSRLGRRPPREKKKKEPKKDGERKAKGYGAPCQLSPALAEIVGTDKMPRCDVVKKMYEIAKEKNLLDPQNKQFMICNDQMLTVFGKKRVRMFGMMKHLNDHIIDPHRMAKS